MPTQIEKTIEQISASCCRPASSGSGDVPVTLDLILIVLLAVLVLALMGDRWL